MDGSEIRELSEDEIVEISGGGLGGGGVDASTGGLAIIGLGFAGGPATAVFGLAIGGSLLYLDNCA